MLFTSSGRMPTSLNADGPNADGPKCQLQKFVFGWNADSRCEQVKRSGDID